MKISQFLTCFASGHRPEIDIVAIDCVPSAQNRLKIYFRINKLLSCAHMEYYLTLGGAIPTSDVNEGLRTARLVWDAMAVRAATGSPTQSPHFPSALVYYKLRQDRDLPPSKVYLPVRRCLPDDLAISQGVQHLASHLTCPSQTNDYGDFLQTML
jgi:DMATS type aromatic prenyltransferase